MRRFPLLVVVGIGVLSAATLSVAQTRSAAPLEAGAVRSGDPDTGKKLYNSYGCYQCHGYEGQGGAAGPRIGPNPLPLAAFRSYTRQPTGQMPPYTVRLVPDADLGHIHAYLDSLPEPPPLEKLPLLQQ